MEKPQKKLSTDSEDTLVKVIKLCRSEGSYGYIVHEIPETILNEHSEIVDKCEPDIYAIFKNNIISLTRRLFGL